MPILVNCECGKQFQTSEDNVGRRTNCPNCGRDLVVPKADIPHEDRMMLQDGPPTGTSGKAITSLVLGIISFALGCIFFTGIPAIIFGAIGLSDIGKSRGRVGGKGMAITGIVLGSIATLLGLLVVPIALLLPAIQAAREAARRSQCVNNLKQMGLAIHNFESATGKFPPAVIKDKDGKPLLSWRVAILPYLEQSGPYNQFKLDEPWDSPTNMAAAAQMPSVFVCPSGATTPGMTTYQAVVGPGTLLDGDDTSFPLITDGTSNTLAVIEAKTPVPWTKPEDVDINTVMASVGSRHPGGFNVLFADGSVRFIKMSVNPKVLQALCTKAGNEVISSDAY